MKLQSNHDSTFQIFYHFVLTKVQCEFNQSEKCKIVKVSEILTGSLAINPSAKFTDWRNKDKQKQNLSLGAWIIHVWPQEFRFFIVFQGTQTSLHAHTEHDCCTCSGRLAHASFSRGHNNDLLHPSDGLLFGKTFGHLLPLPLLQHLTVHRPLGNRSQSLLGCFAHRQKGETF